MIAIEFDYWITTGPNRVVQSTARSWQFRVKSKAILYHVDQTFHLPARAVAVQKDRGLWERDWDASERGERKVLKNLFTSIKKK